MATSILTTIVLLSSLNLAVTSSSSPSSSVHNESCLGFGCARLNLSLGMVKGNVWEHGEEFLMIPYAAPTHRFEASTPVLRFNNIVDATNIDPFGKAACMQGAYLSNESSYGVEDCLILNLYRPRTVATKPRPILVWIFGGDNSASEIIPYNATRLAGQHDAIVVVVSYRLNIFGFSAFEEDSPQSTGNNGMLDILVAMNLIQKEAANIGGDPTRITTFGESSGATDSQIFAMVDSAKGVVAASISESGGLYAQSLEDAIKNTKEIARAVGCEGIIEPIKLCLQRKPVADIVKQAGNYDWGPTVDNVFLKGQPAALLAAGKINPNVSVLWGGNTNDSATVFMLDEYVSEKSYVNQLNATVHGYSPPGLFGGKNFPRRKISGHRHHARVIKALDERRAALKSTLNNTDDDLFQRALALYPPRKFGDKNYPLGNCADLVGWFDSDRFLCNIRREMVDASKAVSGSTGFSYSYRFDWLFQSDKSCIADSNYHNPLSGSNHCDEMTFVMGQPIFDNQDPPGYSFTNCSDPESAYYDEQRCTGCVFNPSEQKFSSSIGAFWVHFARTGNPNSAKLNGWGAFNVTDPINIVLHPDALVVEENMGRTDACALWDAVETHCGSHC